MLEMYRTNCWGLGTRWTEEPDYDPQGPPMDSNAKGVFMDFGHIHIHADPIYENWVHIYIDFNLWVRGVHKPHRSSHVIYYSWVITGPLRPKVSNATEINYASPAYHGRVLHTTGSHFYIAHTLYDSLYALK